MKKIVVVLLFVLYVLDIHAQYNCIVVSGNNETVTYRVTGYGRNVKKAINDAELSAVKALCFYGAAGTSYSSPLISIGQSNAEIEHCKFFAEFYETTYKNFVETSSVVVPFNKDTEKRKCITLEICIRALQLRTYFEKSGIIRKFGL